MATLAHVDALQHLSDRELIAETRRLAEGERHATAHVIAALMEMDARRLYLGEGCSSLFTYCTQVLHFSEHAAYGRIEAARAARRFPEILDQLADGSLTLTAVSLLAAHLTPENHVDLLSAARNKSKREVEHVVAALRPLPAVPSLIRKLPAGRPLEAATAAICSPPPGDSLLTVPIPASTKPRSEAPSPAPAVPCPAYGQAAPPRAAVVAPLAPERYKVQITISREARDKLCRAQDLLRHSIPGGDPAAIVERALTLLVEDLERRKLAAATRPRVAGTATPGSRYVPAAVKREVWARDEGRCAFVGGAGRCTERSFLELHHVVPFADGGATDVGNLQLRCRAHNAYEAEQWFGPLVVRERQPDFQSAVCIRQSAFEETRSGPSCWYPCAMADHSGIEWTESTWNPTVGCTKVSPGCDRCYAERMTRRFPATYPQGFALTLRPSAIDLPRRWRRPRTVFVNSMSDLFHADVPEPFIRQVFDVMVECPQHTFQILTKRAERAARLAPRLRWPENVWMGVSVENLDYAWRIEYLRSIPAAMRFISAEPLLAALPGLDLRGVDWLIVGGESQSGCRPVSDDWFRDLRDQCASAGVAFFLKQLAPPTAGMNGIQALIDTGASESYIDSVLAAQLNLPIVDARVVSGVHGPQEVNMHLAQVYVRGLNVTIYGTFAGVHLAAGGQPHKALLGRTFLQAFTMVYEGGTGTVTISSA